MDARKAYISETGEMQEKSGKSPCKTQATSSVAR